MNYLFWNTGKSNIDNVLKKIIHSMSCDVVGLAEFDGDVKKILELINENSEEYVVVETGCQRINIIARKELKKVKHLQEDSYYTIKQIRHDKLGFLLIVFLHFPSQRNMEEEDYLEELRLLKADIEQAEKVCRHNKTVIVGDFNINPFDRPMVSATGFYSVNSRGVASKLDRTLRKEKYLMFYNPMWNLFGDFNKPPGTYYYNKSSAVNYYWHILDQVIIRPSLIEHFEIDNLKIIHEVQGEELVTNEGHPKYSDHLPIYFSIV